MSRCFKLRGCYLSVVMTTTAPYQAAGAFSRDIRIPSISLDIFKPHIGRAFSCW